MAFNNSGIRAQAYTPTFSHNDVYGNTAYQYSGVSPNPPTADICVDPEFIDMNNGNYHLADGSLCINVDDNNAVLTGWLDLDGEPRILPDEGTVDIGVDEYYDSTAPSTPVVTDDGDYTDDNTQLHASWSSSDSESGIAEYQYAIGTAQYPN